MAMALRSEVLRLYRRALRLSRTWVAQEEVNTDKERKYIATESRDLFKKNQSLTDPVDITKHIQEGNARIDIAEHYKIPYPRMMNFPQHTMPPTAVHMKKGRSKMKEATPLYAHSTYD